MMKKLVFTIFLVLCGHAYSQSANFLPKGLGLEIGAGFNQLKHHVFADEFSPSNDFSRKEFMLTPTIRFGWKKELFANFGVTPFSSYSITGGKSSKRENGYEDEHRFHSLEIGLFTFYSLQNMTFSFGSKYNRFLKNLGKSYGSVLDTPTETKSWSEDDLGFYYKNWSMDLGGRMAYNVNHFIVAVEGWFSLTELEESNIDALVDVSSNRVHMLVGYRL